MTTIYTSATSTYNYNSTNSTYNYNSTFIATYEENHFSSEQKNISNLNFSTNNRYKSTNLIVDKCSSSCNNIAKILWEKKKKSLLDDPSPKDCVTLKHNLKEAIRVVLNFAKKFFNESECTFTDCLLNDLSRQTLHELKSKYFNENSETKKNLNLPYALDLIDFFANNSLLNGSTIEQFLTQEESILENLLSEQAELKAMNRNEMLRILIYLKECDRLKNDRGLLNAYVVDFSELDLFMAFVSKIAPTEPIRIQLLVRNDVHYTEVELELSQAGNRCLILDAALDPRYLNIAEVIQKYPFDKIYAAGDRTKIQMDTYSCSAFSLDHSFNTSKIEKLFKMLKQLPQTYDPEKNIIFIDWGHFPASLVKNWQSMSLLAKHKEWKVPGFKETLSFEDYIHKQATPREIRGEIKLVNARVEKKFECYSAKCLEALSQIDRSLLMRIATTDPVVQLRNDFKVDGENSSKPA